MSDDKLEACNDPHIEILEEMIEVQKMMKAQLTSIMNVTMPFVLFSDDLEAEMNKINKKLDHMTELVKELKENEGKCLG